MSAAPNQRERPAVSGREVTLGTRGGTRKGSTRPGCAVAVRRRGRRAARSARLVAASPLHPEGIDLRCHLGSETQISVSPPVSTVVSPSPRCRPLATAALQDARKGRVLGRHRLSDRAGRARLLQQQLLLLERTEPVPHDPVSAPSKALSPL